MEKRRRRIVDAKKREEKRIALTTVLNWRAILFDRYGRNFRDRSVADIQQATSPRCITPAGLGIWTDLLIASTSNDQKPPWGLKGCLRWRVVDPFFGLG